MLAEASRLGEAAPTDLLGEAVPESPLWTLLEAAGAQLRVGDAGDAKGRGTWRQEGACVVGALGGGRVVVPGSARRGNPSDLSAGSPRGSCPLWRPPRFHLGAERRQPSVNILAAAKERRVPSLEPGCPGARSWGAQVVWAHLASRCGGLGVSVMVLQMLVAQRGPGMRKRVAERTRPCTSLLHPGALHGLAFREKSVP